MSAPVIVAFLLGMKAAWFGKRLIQNNFNLKVATAAILQDVHWDEIKRHGTDAVSLARVILESPIDIRNSDDFKNEVMGLKLCKQKLNNLPSGVVSFLNDEICASDHLERRMRHAVTEYASLLCSIEQGTPTRQLSAMYLGLYLLGRLDRPLDRRVAEQILEKLISFHTARKQPIDVKVRDSLRRFSSSIVQELMQELRDHPVIKTLKIDPEYVIFVLMGYRSPKLTSSGLFDEMVSMAEVPEHGGKKPAA